MTKSAIEQILKETFQPTHLLVLDEGYKHIGHAGAKQGGHFDVTIVSPAFEGKTLLQRHRMVYQAIAPIKDQIHALAIKAKTPTEI